jgi:hypothetical protein
MPLLPLLIALQRWCFFAGIVAARYFRFLPLIDIAIIDTPFHRHYFAIVIADDTISLFTDFHCPTFSFDYAADAMLPLLRREASATLYLLPFCHDFQRCAAAFSCSRPAIAADAMLPRHFSLLLPLTLPTLIFIVISLSFDIFDAAGFH